MHHVGAALGLSVRQGPPSDATEACSASHVMPCWPVSRPRLTRSGMYINAGSTSASTDHDQRLGLGCLAVYTSMSLFDTCAAFVFVFAG